MEILVALMIIATSLLLLLTTLRQGLNRLETCRSEFQSCLSMQTAVGSFSYGTSLPSEKNTWTPEETEIRPGLKIIKLQQGDRSGKVWTSKLEIEIPAEGEANLNEE